MLNCQQGFWALLSATFARLKRSVFITWILHVCVWILKPSGGHQGIPFPYCLLAALCVCQRCNSDSEPRALCVIVVLLITCGGVSTNLLIRQAWSFKCAALLWEETLALIKRHTFISSACNGGFHSCQRWMPDTAGYASQWPLRNKNCLIPLQLV